MELHGAAHTWCQSTRPLVWQPSAPQDPEEVRVDSIYTPLQKGSPHLLQVQLFQGFLCAARSLCVRKYIAPDFASALNSSPSSLFQGRAMGSGKKGQGQCPVSCWFTLMRYTQCNPPMESALQKEVIAGCHEQSSSGNWFIYLEAVVAISAQTE